MYLIIVGGGKIGHFLAKRLSADQHTVVLIEKNKKVCEDLAKDLDVVVLHGNGCEPYYLEEAGVSRADVVAAVTGNDEDNLIIAQIAKEKFHVHRTVARVNDPKNEHVFNVLGVDVPIDATEIIAKIIEEEVSFSDFVNLLSFNRGRLAIVRIDLPQDAPVIGKKVFEINFPQDSVLVSVIRKETVIVPRGDTVLEAGDDVIALTLVENKQQLLRALAGKI